MSLRQVLTIFNAERQLNDEETALLNTLRKMSGAELESLAVALAPQVKSKPRKKREAKSARASSLQQQIQSRPRLDPTTAFKEPLCSVCAGTEDYEDHQQSSPHYHEFQPPQKAAATGD